MRRLLHIVAINVALCVAYSNDSSMAPDSSAAAPGQTSASLSETPESTTLLSVSYENYTMELQNRILYIERLLCIASVQSVAHIPGFCPGIFDGISCWNQSAPNRLVKANCPEYFKAFQRKSQLPLDSDYGSMSRLCQDNGTWANHPEVEYNNNNNNNDNGVGWTNFSLCTVCPGGKSEDRCHEDLLIYGEKVAFHLNNIKILACCGYSISIIFLMAAFALMANFRRLHCERNYLHLHLFVSCILRSLFAIVVFIHVEGGAGDDLRKDVSSDLEFIDYYEENYKPMESYFMPPIPFVPANETAIIPSKIIWRCKFLSVLFNYFVTANYFWIFAEGFYMHQLIIVSVMVENRGIKPYVGLGWITPVPIIIAWIILRIYLENDGCWVRNVNQNIFWVMRAPITITIVVNFLFFLNIIRILVTKMRNTPTLTEEGRRYWRLVRSTMVLIPLFGAHYIIFVALPYTQTLDSIFGLFHLYFDMFFNSTQGLCVAIICCFINGEVRTELKNSWRRYRLRRGTESMRNRTLQRRRRGTGAGNAAVTPGNAGDAVPDAQGVSAEDAEKESPERKFIFGLFSWGKESNDRPPSMSIVFNNRLSTTITALSNFETSTSNSYRNSYRNSFRNNSFRNSCNASKFKEMDAIDVDTTAGVRRGVTHSPITELSSSDHQDASLSQVINAQVENNSDGGGNKERSLGQNHKDDEKDDVKGAPLSDDNDAPLSDDKGAPLSDDKGAPLCNQKSGSIPRTSEPRDLSENDSTTNVKLKINSDNSDTEVNSNFVTPNHRKLKGDEMAACAADDEENDAEEDDDDEDDDDSKRATNSRRN